MVSSTISIYRNVGKGMTLWDRNYMSPSVFFGAKIFNLHFTTIKLLIFFCMHIGQDFSATHITKSF